MKTASSPEINVKRAQELYERELRQHVEPGNRGKFIVIDVDENTYSIGDEYPPLLDAALAKDATAQLVVLKIGFPAAVRIRPIKLSISQMFSRLALEMPGSQVQKIG